MRIRKNANISSIIFSHDSGSESLQTHVCQLNQSPWDVIPFAQEIYPSSLHQFEGEDSFNGNVSLGDSIGAVESSVASLMEDPEDKKAAAARIKTKVDNMMIIDDNYEMGGNCSDKKRLLDDYDEEMKFKLKKGEKQRHLCNKTDGKGWHCKNVPKEGQNMCDHHFILLKSYNNLSSSCINHHLPTSSSKKYEKGSSNVSSGRRGGGRARTKKGSSSASTSNPYEFYYYSGFGPLWGKRRGGSGGGGGDRIGDGHKNESKESEIINNSNSNGGADNSTPSSTTSSPIEDNEEFDYVDEEEEDDDDEDSENGHSGGKKRMRKPVKARSLKSLM